MSTINELIAAFPGMDSDNKLMRVMVIGDKGNLEDFPLMKYALLSDPDIDVRFAALKRIHNFKSHPELKSVFDLLEKRDTEEMEPYYSMALSRLGYISLEDFNKRINS